MAVVRTSLAQDSFDLDEPWDSEHNRALLTHMPAVYRSAETSEGTKTLYVLATGRAAVFTPGEDISLDRLDLASGSGNILVVEANAARAVEWTKPDDFAFDPDDIFTGLGGLRTGGFFALQANGLVDFVSFITSPDELRARFRRQEIKATEE